MYKFISIFLLITSLNLNNFALAGELNLKFPTPSKRVVEPGDIINAMVTIENNSDSIKQIIFRHQNNSVKDWKLISDYSNVRVEKKSTMRKIIGIQAPSNIRAGDYSVHLEVLDKSDMLPFGTLEIPVQVIPKYLISVEIFKKPDYIFSGEEANVEYLIQNKSNTDTKTDIRIIDGSNVSKVELNLPKDSSILRTYQSKTDKLATSTSQSTIIIIAQIKGMPETQESTSASIEIYPSVIQKFDKYVRFPIKVSGVAAISNRSGQQLIGGMFDIAGSGSLDKKQVNVLDFHFRGPDRSGNPLFGMNDEYVMNFKNQKFIVSVGHSNFGLSELTESSRNGLGAEVKYNFKHFTIGAYYAQPRYYPLIKNLASASINFNPNLKNQFNLGILTKIDTFQYRTNLISIESKNAFGKNLKSEVEFALSQKQAEWNKAFKGSLIFNMSHWNSQMAVLYADPKYLGYVSNSLRVNIGSTFQMKKSSFTINYNLNSTNMALDTFYTNLPYSNAFNLSANFKIKPTQTLSITGYYNKMKDKALRPLFDYTKTSGRLMYQQRFKSFNLSLMGDIGRMENLLLNSEVKPSLFYNGTLTGYYYINQSFSLSLYTNYQGGKQVNVTGNKLFYYGGTLTTSLKDRLSITAQYNSNFEWVYYSTDRSLLSLNITGKINKNNELQLQGNYNLMRNTLDQKEYNFQFKYTHTLNVPIARKKNFGSVSGKIIDHGVGTVSGVIVNINGINAISDKNGVFKIPVLPVGKYMATVRTNTLGIYAITEQQGPIEIEVLDNKVCLVEIALTNSGRIIGKLEIQEDENANKKNFIPVVGTIDKLIVEASNGKEVFRKYTNSDATFNFDDLRPGSWQVKIYPNGLPSGYSIINSIFTLEIKSGQVEPLKVIIQKKSRKIQFQSTINKK
ncbi:MAG TPA: hypothetical protein VFP20_07670 [Bacteroidales bacterium]|nr:hypothetical protein [Bacteroidales bacterium]